VNVRWTQPALGDIAGVFAYIARDNEAAAIRVVDELMAAGAGLEFHPRLGRPGRVRGTRELVVGRYVLVYRVQAQDELVIVRVVHGARRKR
jgi:toxin ParE1/3/4